MDEETAPDLHKPQLKFNKIKKTDEQIVIGDSEDVKFKVKKPVINIINSIEPPLLDINIINAIEPPLLDVINRVGKQVIIKKIKKNVKNNTDT